MATKLDKTIKREIELDGRAFTVQISPEGVKVTPKGARNGREMTWREFAGVGGEMGGSGGTGGAGAAANMA